MEAQQLNELLTEHQISQQQWQQAMGSAARIEQLSTPAGTYWLKKAAPARGVFRYHALNLFSWLLRLPLLRAVPQPGGEEAISNEVNRLQQLTAAGVLVPRLIAHDSDWLLLEHMGISIVRTLKNPKTPQTKRQQLFAQCLKALRDLHEQNQYLSQGFIRNLLLEPQSNRIAFIDFEDDPLAVMSLSEAQARDVLLLVNSTARFFINDRGFFDAAIKDFLGGHDPEMISALKTTAGRMQWVTKIPFQRLFGHDYQKLKTGILALSDL